MGAPGSGDGVRRCKQLLAMAQAPTVDSRACASVREAQRPGMEAELRIGLGGELRLVHCKQLQTPLPLLRRIVAGETQVEREVACLGAGELGVQPREGLRQARREQVEALCRTRLGQSGSQQAIELAARIAG